MAEVESGAEVQAEATETAPDLIALATAKLVGEAPAEPPVVTEEKPVTKEEPKADASADSGQTARPDKPAEEAAPPPEVSKHLEAVHRAKKKADQEIAAAKAALEKQKAELEAALAKAKEFEAKKNLAVLDPVAFYEEVLGVKSGFRDISGQFLAREMGDQAPKELKEQKQQYSLQKQIEELRGQLERERQAREQAAQQAEAQRFITTYQASVADHLAKATDALFVKAAYSKRPAETLSSLMQVASNLARERMEAGDPTTPTPAEVAEAYNKTLEEEASIFAELFKPKQTESAPATKAETPAKTLSQSKTATSTTKRQAPMSEEERIERAKLALLGKLQD